MSWVKKMLWFGINKQKHSGHHLSGASRNTPKELPGEVETGPGSQKLLISMGLSQVEAQVRPVSDSEAFS